MWLQKDVPVVQPKAIVGGREYAYIHIEGSLHVPLSLKRALELDRKGLGGTSSLGRTKRMLGGVGDAVFGK